MSGQEEEKARKEALKTLRESRRQTIEQTAQRMKEQKKAMDAVRQALKEGSSTVPELAQATSLDASQTMWIIATLKKYGEVSEEEKDGSYFRYRLVDAKA
jgi:hypothetical protein